MNYCKAFLSIFGGIELMACRYAQLWKSGDPNIITMKTIKIIVPVDFTEVTDFVVKAAVAIAKKVNASITLFHVAGTREDAEVELTMKSFATKHDPESGIDFDFLITDGNILHQIVKVARADEFELVVIGSHGYKGLREKIFGIDILKLLKDLEVPALIVQEGYEMPPGGFNSILFPVGSHKNLDSQINTAVWFAGIFDAEVDIYTVEKPGTDWSEAMKSNITKVEEALESGRIRYKKVREKATSFSVGYGRQILDYANRNNPGLITIIANAAREYYYVADSDKVTMLTNEAKIPILSVSAKDV